MLDWNQSPLACFKTYRVSPSQSTLAPRAIVIQNDTAAAAAAAHNLLLLANCSLVEAWKFQLNPKSFACLFASSCSKAEEDDVLPSRRVHLNRHRTYIDTYTGTGTPITARCSRAFMAAIWSKFWLKLPYLSSNVAARRVDDILPASNNNNNKEEEGFSVYKRYEQINKWGCFKHEYGLRFFPALSWDAMNGKTSISQGWSKGF